VPAASFPAERLAAPGGRYVDDGLQFPPAGIDGYAINGGSKR
jgi:hypothetical protein